MKRIIDNGTKFLQNEFEFHMESTIEANLERARRGGVPGTLSRIVAYLNVKTPSHSFYEDGLHDHHPVWTLLFYCLRVGDMVEAGRLAKEAKELSNNPHCASLVGILRNLPKDDVFNDERRLKLRAEWNAQNCRDLHKKAIYGLFLGFDSPEVNGTIEDWLWSKMFHCKFAVDPTRALRQLQTTLCTQHGERYFVGEGGSHLLYFSVLLLTGQIERAVHVLFKSDYRVHSVHMAILAHQLRLVMTTEKVSDELLTTDVHEPSVCRLNLARLLLLYVKDFELSNIEYAINYCFFARDFKLDTSPEKTSFHQEKSRSVFVASVSRIVYMSGEREAILGRLDPRGDRIPGLIDKFAVALDISELIANIAFDTNVQGDSLGACHLYALAKRHTNAIKLVNCHLSMCVTNTNAEETRKTVECAHWLAQQYDRPNVEEENASFSTLLLLLKLHTFFQLTAEEQYGEAIELIKSVKLLPMDPDDVQADVSQFHELVPVEVRPLLPELCVQLMRSIVALYNVTPPVSPTIQLLKQSEKHMSNKNNSRQSNLFAFFQKKPKDEPIASKEEEDVRQLNAERENCYTPQQKRPELAQNSAVDCQSKTPLTCQRQQQQVAEPRTAIATPQVLIMHSDDDEDSRGVGFLSCASSATPSAVGCVTTPAPKRRRVILSSDEEETTGAVEGVAHCQMGDGAENVQQTQSKKKKRRDAVEGTPPSPSTPLKRIGHTHSTNCAQSFINSFDSNSPSVFGRSPSIATCSTLQKEKGTTGADENAERFPHLDYDFLRPDKIKDAKGRRPDHSEFDGRTLFVPEHFMKSQTPGHRQWWKLKSEHFDTILFFKVGKFYELYHMDAVIAVENLGLVFMRGKQAHCGFPEIGYGKFSDQLVNRGFKVARVEQTETPQQLADRQNKVSMSQEREKVVRREICRVTTRGTKTYGVQDGTDSTVDSSPNYLMALAEKVFCFVDCSIAAFKLAEFDDDANQSNLRTLLAHNYPAQLLYEKGVLSPSSLALFNTMLSTVPKEALLPKRQFCSAETALKTLCDDNYFGPDLNVWPESVRQMLASPDAALPASSECHKLCLSSLGAVLWYLKHCLVDVDTVSMRQFSKYNPPSTDNKENRKATNNKPNALFWKGKHMVLDGVSLTNLHIVPSLSVAVPRLLRQWISAPICERESLLARQKSIEWLLSDEMRPNSTKMVELLRKIPDLERFFQRIHSIGLKYRADSANGHPDSRANFFEADKYNKRKIRDLLVVLDGLEDVQKLMRLFKEIKLRAEAPSLLVECLSTHHHDMVEDLAFFEGAFARENALERGVILPRRGVDVEYDATCKEIEKCKADLEDYLNWASKKLKCSPKFFGTGRNSYQMEIPESACHHLTDDFQLTSQRKGYKRYTTNNLQKLVDRLNDAEVNCATISAEVTRRVFADLDARKNKWSSIVHQIATFDCLMALSLYAQSSSHKMCFPDFVFEFDAPFVDIQRGFHPSLTDINCVLGCGPTPAYTMLLTGPNMGGKSTFMRQVASLVTLAHIGSMVPADSMRLTPVDRIFCRIGASDRLSVGQSTFFVELSETNTILLQATRHSLVLIDELALMMERPLLAQC
uniref:DNA mismatch repair protein n=1 Tax=Globodera rostochiensis TaxID=31243 RepID=A0A914HRU2_GLORO